MLTFEQIKDLIDQVASHRLSGFELERSGFRLKIDGQRLAGAEAAHPTQAPAAATPPEAVASAASVAPPEVSAPAAFRQGASGPTAVAEPPAADVAPQDLYVLNSPIVGTFYRSPSPESPVFVEVGDRVSSGQILCIVEAMKLMNEIESDTAGTIVEIYIENAQPVEYGEPLFAIKTS